MLGSIQNVKDTKNSSWRIWEIYKDNRTKTKEEREKMLTTYNEIKAQLIDEWDSVRESRLHEYAEDYTPVYYSQIAKDWQELPMENSDEWKRYGIDISEDTTIFSLMATDLHLYYFALVEKAFAEITEEKQQEENERE
jgi:hypothetical protein